MTRSLLPVICLILACGLSGCLNTDPVVVDQKYYVLDTGYAAASEIAPEARIHRIGLKPIILPGYLQDTRLTVRKSENRLLYLEQDRWAGRLQKVLADFLSRQLEEHLETTAVRQAPWNRGFVGYELGLKFIRCEVTIDGLAVVRAEWTCTDLSNPDNTRIGSGTVRKQGPNPLDATDESIATLSDALSELSVSIAKTVRDCYADS